MPHGVFVLALRSNGDSMTAQAPQGALPTPRTLPQKLHAIADDMPQPWDEDRRYSESEVEQLIAAVDTVREAADHIDAQARQIADLERHCAGLGDENTRALRELAAAQQALGEAERDAGRYRWMRQPEDVPMWERAGLLECDHTANYHRLDGEALDAAIDAALTQAGSKG